MGSGKTIARAFDGIPSVQIFTATFKSSTSEGKALVDAGDGNIPVVNTGQYFPLTEDTVRILRINDQMILLGLASPPPPRGTIEAVGIDPGDLSTVLDVRTDDGDLHKGLRVYDSVILPAVGDNVSINWPIGGVVEGRFKAAPVVPPITPPGSGSTHGSAEFHATDSGSFRAGGWWQNDVWYSDTNTGAWFYGATIHDSIPATATVNRIQLYLPRYYALGGQTTFGSHTSSTKPSGNVAVTNNWDTGDTGWVDAPLTWASALLGGGGIGTAATGHGFNKYSGTGADAQSGALRIDWTT